MESLRLFRYAENTRWSLLPVPGGLYDQHPKLLDEWDIIWEIKAAHEEEVRRAQEQKLNKRGRR
jgi:hypothetical protein